MTEYVAGPSLKEAVEEGGPLGDEAVTGLAAALANALASVHAAGVVHRDIKPSNVILGPHGPLIIDFGISSASESTRITRTSLGIGSPAGMSPEAALGKPTQAAADVFAWGALVAYAATGRPPFGEGPTHAVLYRVVAEDPDLDGIGEPLLSVVRAALAKDPATRPDATELAQALAQPRRRRRRRVRRGPLAAGVAGLVAVAAVTSIFLAGDGGGGGTPNSNVSASGAQLYVSTSATPGDLYTWPEFPTSIQLDNYDAVNDLTWTRLASTVTATGGYEYDACNPNCAADSYVDASVQITLAQPVECTIEVEDAATGKTSAQRALVYSSITTKVEGAGAPAHVAGLHAPACTG